MPDGKNAIADRGEIAWFRKRIKADSSLSDALVLNIFQYGASEIYLDGKLIHKIGRVSANPDSVIYVNPDLQLFQFPLIKGKEQVLAVRYQNAQYKYPIYNDDNGLISIATTSLHNSNSRDIIKNFRIAYDVKSKEFFYLSSGLAILMFIIFLSLFIFFPNEKINGYFSLSNFFLICFTLGLIAQVQSTGDIFWHIFFYDTSILASNIILLYCGYRILEQKIDAVFKVILFLSLISVGLFFFFNPNTIAPLWVLTVYLAFIRIGVHSWNKNRTGSLIFLISSALLLLFWILFSMDVFGIVRIFIIRLLIPFAFMVPPITLSVYLGYAYGKKSQALRLNLESVQRLSQEKEQILLKQNETLEQQVRERTSSLNDSLENLKSTQSQLIQSEKMAFPGRTFRRYCSRNTKPVKLCQ